MKEVACFISPHGYGHATRAIAVLEALQSIYPGLYLRIFTTVPETLFHENLVGFSYHRVKTDVGLAQSSALECDINTTITELESFWPPQQSLVTHLAAFCENCSLVLCDISPLGIQVAKELCIPSVLVENFTWDWIYTAYTDTHPALAKHQKSFQELYKQANYHIQTEPLCALAPRDLLCGPIFRRSKGTEQEIRIQLQCEGPKVIVITMGGVVQKLPNLDSIKEMSHFTFVFTGQEETRRLADNIILVNRNSKIYHPDLLAIAEVVVCKVGYSTIAECCQAGARVISVGRTGFPESAPLQAYLKTHLGGVSITPAQYESSEWLSLIPDLLAVPKPLPATENGADRVAAFLVTLLQQEDS